MDKRKNLENRTAAEGIYGGGMEQIRTLYVYELKKIVCRKIVWVTAGIMLFLCVFMSFAGLLGTAYSFSESGKEESVVISGFEWMKMQRESARALSGRKIDDTLLREMQEFYRERDGEKEDGKETAETYDFAADAYGSAAAGGSTEEESLERKMPDMRYLPVYSYVQWILQDEERTNTIDAEGLYSERERLVTENREDQMLTEGELAYWEEQDARLSAPFVFAYMEGWKSLWDQANVINCMLLLLLSISLAGIFSVEHQRRTDAMILCSRYGKRTLYFVKMLAGITFGAAAALLLFGTAVASNVVVRGADGLKGALQIVFPLSSRRMCMGGSVLLLLFLLLVISVLYSTAIMFLSEWLKKSVGVMAVPVGIMIFTLFVDVPYRFKTLSQIYDLLPTNLLMRQELWDDRLFSVLGNHMTNFQIAPAVYMLLSILLFAMGKRIYQK